MINEIQNNIIFTPIDYIENLNRLYSLIRVSQSDISNNNEAPLSKRDYYFNNTYIGNIIINLIKYSST